MIKSVVLAPDKFKGSLSAVEAARAMKRGVLAAVPGAACEECPMADGGEGTVDVFLSRGASRRTAEVRGPRGARVDAVYALDGETAILEMASASGLGLLESAERDPTRTDTFGTGQLLTAALDAGARRVVLGIGGSATNDAGTGMLRALGVRFLDSEDRPIDESILAFERLTSIDVHGLDRRIARTTIDVAVDVDNPLCGPQGASYVYAPQKGATQEQVELLDRVLRHIAAVAHEALGRDYATERGAGAAGGLGFALFAFAGARPHRGVDLIARECGLERLLRGASLCMTGEGKIDEQTLAGKTVSGVARLARKHKVPVVAFGGAVDPGAAGRLRELGVDVNAIAPAGTTPQDSMRRAASFLEEAARTAAARYAG